MGLGILWAALSGAGGTTLYSIGNPTVEEQAHLELINRARANPAAEGERLKNTTDTRVLSAVQFFGVNLNLMATEMAALPPAPPLAMNAKLVTAARDHSADMLTWAFQGHVGSNGSTLGTRLAAVSYVGSAGENVYSYADSVFHAHAGFEIDWGTGSGGMQNGRGHRVNIHNAGFREVGVGVILGTNTVGGNTVGPQIVTQKFGSGAAATAYVTGVVYHDLNGNALYDAGEGIGGVRVDVEGSSFHAVTADAGGYAVPVPTTSILRPVTFSGPGISSQRSALIVLGQNVKVDLVVPYSPAVVTGPATPAMGAGNGYQVTPVAGAVSYEWRSMRSVPVEADPAENLSRVNVLASPSYQVLQTAVKHAGNSAYQLAHPDGVSPSLTYKDSFIASAGAAVSFRSRLGWATPSQVARVQVSTDQGSTWENVYSQAGTSSSGEGGFTERNASLAAYAGKEVRIRFLYEVSGSRYSQTSSGVGWYIDSVSFSNLSGLADLMESSVAGAGFTFTPSALGNFLLSARPVFPGREGIYGPMLAVDAVDAPVLTGYALWASQAEVASGLPAGALGDAGGDFNRDGVPNLVAFGLGLSAVAPSAHLMPKPQIQGGMLVLNYQVNAGADVVTVVPQATGNLAGWHGVGSGGAPAGFTDVLVSTQNGIQNRRASVPVGGGGKFLRLVVSRP